jgi:hypothetical protein
VIEWLEGSSRGAWWTRGILVVVAICLPQTVMYWPSLLGQQVLLPLDILQLPGWYLPIPEDAPRFVPQNIMLSDVVLQYASWRLFAIEEVQAGRLPLWNPYNYCGHPFVAPNQTAIFSPFHWADYLFPSFVTIAWMQLAKSLVAGCGAYFFFRRVLRVKFLPATAGAAAYPLIGFMVLWQGFPLSAVCAWLPWLLLAADMTISNPRGWGGPILALATAATLVTGHAETAAHVLLACGIYAVWRWGYGLYCGEINLAKAFGTVVALSLGWGLGFLLSAPQNLPTLEYLPQTNRIAARLATTEVHAPLGARALPQFFLPHFQGSWSNQSWYLLRSNQSESAAAGYGGLIFALLCAPLAWCNPRLRAFNWLWTVAGLLAAAYILNIWGFVQLSQLPVLNVLKHARFVLFTAWCVLALAVTGLDTIARADLHWRGEFRFAVAILVILGCWSLGYLFSPPAEISHPEIVAAREAQSGVPANVATAWFRRMFLASAVICAAAGVGWLLVFQKPLRGPGLVFAIGLFGVAEMTYQAWGINPQCDPALYFPRIETLARLSELPAGRAVGWLYMPGNLSIANHLRDIRGYDAADPKSLVDLLALCERQYPDLSFPKARSAAIRQFLPVESPIMDLLGVRYRIHVGPQPENQTAVAAGDGIWIEESSTALSRAFIPQQAIAVTSQPDTLELLADPEFDPRQVAFVESSQVSSEAPCQGTATIVRELPMELEIEAELDRPGLLVVADLWYPGWKAEVDGQPAPILRANHTLRGVELPAGKHQVRMVYEPASFWLGVRWAAAASVCLLGWCGLSWWTSRSAGGVRRF